MSETTARAAIDRLAKRIVDHTRGKTTFSRARETARESIIRVQRKKKQHI